MDNGNQAPSGLYTCRIVSGSNSSVLKLMLTR
jgi:hypothetical protein